MISFSNHPLLYPLLFLFKIQRGPNGIKNIKWSENQIHEFCHNSPPTDEPRNVRKGNVSPPILRYPSYSTLPNNDA